MKIVRMRIEPVELRLKTPFSIAYETIESATNIFCRLDTDEGVAGFGSCCPDRHVTGETAGSVIAAWNEAVAPALKGADPLRAAFLTNLLAKVLPKQPSALALVDIALHDLLGKVAGLPLYKILGGFRDSMATSVTIGIMPTGQAVEKALRYVSRGFGVLKIKGGKNFEEDAERAIKIREAAGESIRLRFDANQGYTEREACRFMRLVRPAGLELLEQPVDRNRRDLLGRVARGADLPIMADESLMDLKDAFDLAAAGAAHSLNVKLMKVGGISAAQKIDSVAEAAGMKTMAGCMDEAGLSISAGLHFALARKNVAYADLDGHLDLVGDPTSSAVVLRDGVLHPTGEPGLGFRPDEGFPLFRE